MPEQQALKSERTPHKKVIKLPPAIGDWTTYKPAKVFTKKVRSGLYGFDRLSEDSLDQALKIHYDFIRDALYYLRVELKIGNELHTLSGEQSDYLHFLRSSSGHVVQFKIIIPGFDDAAVMLIDLSLANTIVNHTLGTKDTEIALRGLTELENQILSRVMAKLSPAYAKAFSKAFSSAEIKIINSPDITVDPAINPTNSFLTFAMDVAFNDNPPAKIIIGYPGDLMKALLDKINHAPGAKTLSLNKLPATLLNKLSIPVNVSLGETAISTAELQTLETGDVISLERSIDSAIEVKIGDKITLLGQPGKADRKVTTRIVGLRHDEKIKVKPVIIEETEGKKAEDRKIEPASPAAASPAKAPATTAPPPPPAPPQPKAKPAFSTLKDKIKSIDLDEKPAKKPIIAATPIKKPKEKFSLEAKPKEEYAKEKPKSLAKDLNADFEDDLADDFDEDVLGEEDLSLDDFSLKDEDLELNNFSLKDMKPKKKPEAKNGS